MKAHTCYHCKQWVEDGEAHDCWTTTEGALTRDLPEDLRDAWERLREVLGEHGDQRIYASHNSIMFSRKACYAFVRPSAKRLELYFFLGRTERSPIVHKSGASSSVKIAHRVNVTHRDQVEAPLTDWLREAYDVSDSLTNRRGAKSAGASGKAKATSTAKATPKSKAGAKTKVGAKSKAGVKPKPKTKAKTARSTRAATKGPAPHARRRTASRAKAR